MFPPHRRAFGGNRDIGVYVCVLGPLSIFPRDERLMFGSTLGQNVVATGPRKGDDYCDQYRNCHDHEELVVDAISFPQPETTDSPCSGTVAGVLSAIFPLGGSQTRAMWVVPSRRRQCPTQPLSTRLSIPRVPIIWFCKGDKHYEKLVMKKDTDCWPSLGAVRGWRLQPCRPRRRES